MSPVWGRGGGGGARQGALSTPPPAIESPVAPASLDQLYWAPSARGWALPRTTTPALPSPLSQIVFINGSHRRPRSQFTMLLDLSKDLLVLVADFLQDRTLSHACRWAWRVLQYRFVTCALAGADSERCIAAFRHKAHRLSLTRVDPAALRALHRLEAMRSVRHFRLRATEDDVTEGLVTDLLRAPSLHSLELWLWQFESPKLQEDMMAPSVPMTLEPLVSALRAHAQLRTVVLMVPFYVTDAGAEMVAQLAALPRLRRVRLEFPDGLLTAAGAQHLAAFRRCEHLTDLSLGLTDVTGEAGDDMLRALCAIKDTPRLRSFMLLFSRVPVTDAGIRQLAGFAGLPALRAMTLDLTGPSTIGRNFLLEAFAAAPALRHFSLDLWPVEASAHWSEAYQQYAPPPPDTFRQGYRALTEFALRSKCNVGMLRRLGDLCHLPALRSLKLDLCENDLKDGYAEIGLVCAVIRRLPRLRCLGLSCWNTPLGNQGLVALAGALQDAQCLQRLALDLGLTDMGPVGASALAQALRTLTSLVCLKLELDSRYVKDHGAEAFRSLRVRHLEVSGSVPLMIMRE